MDIPRLSERLLSMIFRRRLEIEVSELKPVSVYYFYINLDRHLLSKEITDDRFRL